jgi:hypothetical protein
LSAYLDVRNMQALRARDGVWLGFWDYSDTSGAGLPYRVVRVHGACSYETAFELARRGR